MNAGRLFPTKRTNRMKLVFWEGSDVSLLAKPLENGELDWRKIENDDIQLAPAQLSALFEGLDWSRTRRLAVGEPARPRGSRSRAPSRLAAPQA